MAIISVQEDGGGDFTTLAAALADAGTGAGDTINIEGAWDDPDVTECTVADDNITMNALAGSKHVGRPWAATETTYRLWTTGSGHTITVNNTGLTVDGLDIQNTSTGESNEVIRQAASNPTFKNCVMGFASRNSEQDILYYGTDTASTISFENCMFYNAYRAVVDFYDVDADCTINYNCCSGYDIGYSATSSSRSGLFGTATGGNTYTVNIFNSIIHINTGNVGTADSTPTFNLTIDRTITNVDASYWAEGADSETVTDSLVSHNFTDDNTKSSDGDWVIVEDVTTSPYDLRLQTNTYNEAQDLHADGSGANLTMPATDLIGTSRPQNTNYDCGVFEIVAAVGDAIPMAMNIYRQRRA